MPLCRHQRGGGATTTTSGIGYLLVTLVLTTILVPDSTEATYDTAGSLTQWLNDIGRIWHRTNDNANDDVVVETDVAIRCYDHALQDELSIEAHRLHTPSELLEQNVYAFRFPVSHLEWLQVTSIDVTSLRWEGEADFCNTSALGHSADSVRLAWGESGQMAHFADLPAPCDADTRRDMHYGLSLTSNAVAEWGSVPRVEHSGRLFRPRGGRQAMDVVVSRLNTQRDALGTAGSVNTALASSEADGDTTKAATANLLYFSLSIYYRSHSAVRLRELVVRKCLIEPQHPRVLDVMSLTKHPRAAGSLSTDLVAPLQAMPVAVSDQSVTPTLVPLRSCVWEEYASGTCFVDLGWVNTGTEAVLARDCSEGNCLHPAHVRAYTVMPELFEVGWFRNHTRVAWFCHGKLPGEWVPLRWELGTLAVQVDQTTPFCRTSTALGTTSQYQQQQQQQWAESSEEVIPFEHYRFDESGLRLWDPTEAATKMDSWLPSDSTDLGASGVHLRGGTNDVVNRLVAARCVYADASCSDSDDSGRIIELVGIIIFIDLIVLAIAIYIGVSDPQALLYIIITINSILLGFVAYNFLFAPSLNRPSGVTRPDPLVSAALSAPNVVN